MTETHLSMTLLRPATAPAGARGPSAGQPGQAPPWRWPDAAALAPATRAAAPATAPTTAPSTAPAIAPRSLPTACLSGVLDELDTGVLVCDARSQVLMRNEAARRELADGGVLVVAAEGSLGVQGGAGLLPLRRAVHAAACDQRHQLLALRVGERTLMVLVQPLRDAPGAEPCAVLLIGRRQLCPELAVQRLGRLYALTEAEKAVLSCLLTGLRVGALAKLRGVAVSTVRTQVAALRAKFGVRRVDDLTRLVAELPPMMGALRSPAARP